jgi:hypothetical protein
MPDWEVRKYRPTKIIIADRPYVITAKHVIESKKLIYRLEPWGTRVDIPGRVICYDEQYVRTREAEYKSRPGRERGYRLLAPAYPLIGFVWSSSKAKLEEKFGICPVRATKWSVVVEIPFALAAALAFWFSFSFEGFLEAFVAMVLLASDLLMRGDDLMREVPVPRGFLEWIWHKRKQLQP